jgi:alkanesulfonate monooxygenase SsuD/methylene tetrahydromethanopterin reductase-like flavin-dependent oxidoreductase (luciferase family)
LVEAFIRLEMTVKQGLLIPPIGRHADPVLLSEIAAAAEVAGWDGVFVWDHVLPNPGGSQAIADPWIALAAMSMTTSRIRLGPMVTPLTRRRPINVARQALTLDHLCGGRLTMGFGLGVDTNRELSGLGEVVDPKLRGQRLDESARILAALWSGETVDHDEEHFEVDHISISPRPVQRPRIPMWFAARGDSAPPVRRAARYDGLVPIQVSAPQLEAMLDLVLAERGTLDGFDVAVRPASAEEYEEFAGLGATWSITETSVDDPATLQIASGHPRDRH